MNKTIEGLETRLLQTEMRVDSDGAIEGYAAVFNEWSELLGYFREKIRPGAFRKTIKEHDIRALFNHDPNYVLGRNKSETLSLKEDKYGLAFKVIPPDTQWANDLRISIERGDINQASFQFDVVRQEWDWNAMPNERELIEVRLYDISVVTFPAYPQTIVSARSLAEMFIGSIRQNADPELLAYMRDQLSLLDAQSPEPDQEVHPGESDEDKARARRLNFYRKYRLQLLELT